MQITGGSPRGSTPNMRWVVTEEGRRGLLKHDRDGCKDFLREQTVAAVFAFFRNPVSKCEQVDRHHFISLVSYNKRYVAVQSLEVTPEHSLSSYRDNLPAHIWDQVAALAFIDTICGQTDRHASNLEFLKDASGNIVSICPPFDNVSSLGREDGDECLLGPTSDRIWYADEIIQWLRSEWPNFSQYWDKYISTEFAQLCFNLPFGGWLLQRRETILHALR